MNAFWTCPCTLNTPVRPGLNNNNNLSFYWSDGTNLLLDCNINSINLSNLSNININVPIYHESNYTGTIIENLVLDDIELNIDLINYHNKITFQNFELELYPNSNTSEDNTNNIISGRQITVRGLDNICIGNSFTTTGLNSIILGNNIGGNYGTQNSGQNLLTTINDLYESIVIGNNSFSNSIIKNIICIGNRNLNNLNLQINNNDIEKLTAVELKQRILEILNYPLDSITKKSLEILCTRLNNYLI